MLPQKFLKHYYIIETLLQWNLYSGYSLRASSAFGGKSWKVDAWEACEMRWESRGRGGQRRACNDHFQRMVLWWWWWLIWHLVPVESCWFQTTVEPPLMSNSPQWPLLYSGYIPNRDLQSCHTDQNFPFIPKSQKFLSQSVTILVKSFNYITSHYDVQASS